MSATRFTPMGFSGGGSASGSSSSPRLSRRFDSDSRQSRTSSLRSASRSKCGSRYLRLMARHSSAIFLTFVRQMAAASAWEERVVRSGARVVLLAAFSAYSFWGMTVVAVGVSLVVRSALAAELAGLRELPETTGRLDPAEC